MIPGHLTPFTSEPATAETGKADGTLPHVLWARKVTSRQRLSQLPCYAVTARTCKLMRAVTSVVAETMAASGVGLGF